ncbi:hypothetical protein NDI49_28395 [Trichocoleus sp. ST-U3]
MKEGSKYQPLLEYLRGSNQSEVNLTFSDIEALIQEILPDSARTKRAWWSNRSKGALQASAWMEAGYRVEDVDLDGQRVKFRKPTIGLQVQRMGDTVLWNSELIKALRLYMGLTQTELSSMNDCRGKLLLPSSSLPEEVNGTVLDLPQPYNHATATPPHQP